MDKFVKDFLSFDKLNFLKYDEKIVLYMLFSHGFCGVQGELKLSDDELKAFQLRGADILSKLFDKARSQTDLELAGFNKDTIDQWKTINSKLNQLPVPRELTRESMLSQSLLDDLNKVHQHHADSSKKLSETLDQQLAERVNKNS